MQLRMKSFFFMVLFFPLACSSAPVTQKNSQLHWYDGHKKKSITLDRSRMAIFHNSPPSKDDRVQGLSPIKRYGNVIFYSVDKDPNKIRAKVRESNIGVLSEVFVNKKGNGESFANAGSVIVFFRKDLKDKVPAIAKEKQIILQKHLNLLGGRGWIVKSPPGLGGLEYANELYALDEVEMAYPNWWRPLSLR